MKTNKILNVSNDLRWQIGEGFHDKLTEGIYSDAATISQNSVRKKGAKKRFRFDRSLDKIVTSRIWGFPIMILILSVVLWLTIIGANYPSGLLADLLIGEIYPWLKSIGESLGFTWWLSGFLFDGVYLALAWVIAVMLPPMAIFFPLFTLLEDFGYLPRVAFNLDNIATRIIDSPRERLIAIITNNFSLCNGRWPTQILIASIFIGALVPENFAGAVSTFAVISIALLGVFFTFIVSLFLSKTMLKGEVSSFTLELPPYRPPHFWKTIYTSLIDRTLIVLWRACVFAAPAGAVIWLISNVTIGDSNIANWLILHLDGFGLLLGLNGVILLAYIVAIPANEIVIPTILMLTVMTASITGVGSGNGVMFELESVSATGAILKAGGWTLLTAINLMLFSLLHNPCSTTIYTIYKETKSVKWTTVASVLPIILGFTVCFIVAQVWRIFM